MTRHTLLLAPLLAVACSSGGPAAPSAAPTTPAPTTTAPTTPPATTPPVTIAPVGGEPVYFRSPTGNIGCAFETTTAVCDIVDKTWSPPPKPATCQYDWGFGVHVKAGRKGEISCASDTALNTSSPVLAYGQKQSRYGFTCESRKDGVRCVHDASGHGFFLSRDRYDLF
jgi:hypothetical protein